MLPFHIDADSIQAWLLGAVGNMVGPITIITHGWFDCTVLLVLVGDGHHHGFSSSPHPLPSGVAAEQGKACQLILTGTAETFPLQGTFGWINSFADNGPKNFIAVTLPCPLLGRELNAVIHAGVGAVSSTV